jgi:hypothetical protein
MHRRQSVRRRMHILGDSLEEEDTLSKGKVRKCARVKVREEQASKAPAWCVRETKR